MSDEEFGAWVVLWEGFAKDLRLETWASTGMQYFRLSVRSQTLTQSPHTPTPSPKDSERP